MNHPQRILLAALAAAIALPLTASAAKADRKKNQAAAPAFSAVDKNSDGAVTESEFLASIKTPATETADKARFATLDKDSDGKLTSAEYAAASTEPTKRKKKETTVAKADKKKKASDPGETFATIDKDSDGFVTKTEYVGLMTKAMGESGATARFGELDKNSDGKLSKDEYSAGSTEPKKRRGKKNKN